MELFEASATDSHSPLAERLRPKDWQEFVGQHAALDKSPIRALIEKDEVPSLIIWGPPGCGKTSFAKILAQKTQKEFLSLNAVDTGAKILKEIGDQARSRRQQYAKGTIVFIDEIHRLNKSQQDVLLPFVERGDFILIGATTENPSFEVNSALLSRCRLLVFQRLDRNDLWDLFVKATNDKNIKSILKPDTIEALLAYSDGDGRRLLNSIEQVLKSFEFNNKNYDWPLSWEDLKNVLGASHFHYDKSGEAHYDTISAFIKSIRGSDPDAGLYYLARLLEGGEDPLFIARRLVILASEDVGNADPRGLQMAIAAQQAVHFVGLPEAAINLAQAVTYLACAPKSNRSYMGLKRAQKEVRETGALPIPLSVRNAPTKMMKELGYGADYNYAHEGSRGWLPQNFLPEGINSKKFYEPSERGFEKQIRAYQEWIKSQNQE